MVPSYPSQSERRSEEIAAGLPSEDGSVNAVDEGRKLFAHFLWSAAMVVAEGVEKADTLATRGELDADTAMWMVRGERVLELGAGTALPSIICARAHAAAVTITDHPSSPALTGAIDFNIRRNLAATEAEVMSQPHEWGMLEPDPWAVAHRGAFTRIIAADCYWVRSQHENLVRSMNWFLAPGGKIWVVAGFHTGRAIVAWFFETAMQNGLEIERIYERDLIATSEDGGEVRREWMPEREGEGPENRRRWCVVALLQRRE